MRRVTDKYSYILEDERIKQGDEGWAYTYGTSLINSGRGRITPELIKDNGKNGLYFYKIISSNDPLIEN